MRLDSAYTHKPVKVTFIIIFNFREGGTPPSFIKNEKSVGTGGNKLLTFRLGFIIGFCNV